MSRVKADKSVEVRHLTTILLSSVLLFLIFCAVWIIKKFKTGVL